MNDLTHHLKAATLEGQRHGFYLLPFADESTPFSLQGWANYLAGSDGWHDRGPLAIDGDLFHGMRVTYRYLPAIYTADGWQVPDPPEGSTWHAVAYGPGDGWDAEAMADSRDGILRLLILSDDYLLQWIVFRVLAEEPVTVRYFAATTDRGPGLRLEGAA
jgi:hypothetical protein